MPEPAVIWGALPLLVIFWGVPLMDISYSRQVVGAEKYLWVVACVFTSWLAWTAFYLLAPIKRAEP
ncbi:hypothetical protein KO507_09195 [Gilvimarinus agarilyticus]|uniref:hypothetical protein n=1 Tax=unclassified Gilvimarinus TaxID=2642066 RepID=UPI001C08BA92|nr:MULTISPECIES: hypothetical protein [unclassified Gilvimarinus]MBU2885935.1 hypothetical protein [Gilvimarinus agarilyticus]MDO6570681.1 hypothetical protein [Gilvimarinus sp. 2_MG-2023]MDO6747726.1 hypothetical protein [Gilvimarinus sp. 1_MG-2023]